MKVWSKEKIEKIESKRIILITAMILSFILTFVTPLFFLLGIVLLILNINVKKQRTLRDELDMENILLRDGYKKICKGIFVDEQKQKINILNKEYGFSQIVNCELIVNNKSLDNVYSKTKGKVKKNGKIKANTHNYKNQTSYCEQIYINILVDDLQKPNIKINLKENYNLNVNSKKYKETIAEAEKVVSMLKVIISRNNEKYIENGTVTKVEHKYITEENASIQIERLSQLHKDGILTDYEFEMKKKELLDKIK